MANKEEEIYKKILNNTPTAAIIHANNKILSVNSLFLTAFRTTEKEIIGKSPLKLVPPNLRNTVLERIKTHRKNNDRDAIEEKLLRADGSTFYGEVSASSIVYDNTPASFVLMWDITERKLTEEKLLKNEAQLKEAQEIAHLGHWELDIVNNKLDWSDEIFRIFDLEPQQFEATYEALLKNIHPDDREIVNKAYKESLINKTPYDITHRLKLKDGTIKFVREKCNTQFDENDKPIRSLGTVQDITELVLKDDALKRSEEKYRKIFAVSPDVVSITRLSDGMVFEVNESFEKIIGYNREEIIGKTTSELNIFVNYNDRKTIMNLLKENGSFNNIEIEYYSKNGDIVVGLVAGSIIEINKIAYLVAVTKDITKNKKDTLQNIKLSNIVEQLPITVVITDLDGNIEYANPKFEETTGYTLHEAIGKNPRILKSGTQSTEIYDDLWETILSGNIWEGLFNNKRKCGELYWEEAVIAPIKNMEGETINYVALKVDVTKRISLEKRLKNHYEDLENTIEMRTKELSESEERFRTIAEHSDDSIMRFDKECKHIYVNPVVVQQTGVTQEKFIGKTHAELGFPKVLTNLLEKTIKNVFSTKQKKRIEFQLPNRLWIDWVVMPEFDINGSVEEVICFGRDITQLKIVEQKIKNSLKQERELGKLKGKFISTVTHEFRTPLTSIYSSVELLEKYSNKWEKSKIENYYNTIKNSVENLNTIIDKTLEYSKIESGGIHIKKERLVLKNLCKNIILEHTPLLKKGQVLTANCNSENEYLLDENILRVIMTNLISNAIKYSAEGETIEIIANDANNFLVVEVVDKGIGIDEKDLKSIFNPYFRSSKVQNEIGTGLGLAITKSYVSLLGGKIEVESKVNVGTKFILSIPI